MIRTVTVISLILTGCADLTHDTPQHTVTVTETITETVTVTAPADAPPLTIAFSTKLSGEGNKFFQPGDQHINFGAVQFTAPEPLVVQSIELAKFVNAEPGFGTTFTVAEQNGVNFDDHFENCVLEDADGNLVATTSSDNPDWMMFWDTLEVTIPANEPTLFQVFCDHTGLDPEGTYDVFAIDGPFVAFLFTTYPDGGPVNGVVQGELNGHYPGNEGPNCMQIDLVLETN